MICNWCKQEIKEGAQFCTHCGKPITDSSNYNNQATINTHNEEQNNINSNNYNWQNNNNFNNQKEDKANIGLAILSWFIPLAGLIIFLVKKDKEPKTAKVSGICALISFILNIIIVGLTITFAYYTTKNVIDNIPDYDYEYEENYDYENDDTKEEEDNTVNDNEDENTSNTSTNWKKYEFSVNNKTLKLPTTYDELSNATGFSFKSSQLKSYIESNYYTTINMYKNDKLALYTEILNDTKEDKLYTDCKITRVSQTKYQVSNGADIIIFPGGLKAGDRITEADLINLFGTPNDTNEYSNDGYESKTYKYYENETWTTTNNFQITIVNGVIDEIQLDNR